MKPQQLAALIAALAVLALAVIFLPVLAPNSALGKVFPRPKLGLDIQGGARVVLEAQTDKLGTDQKWDQDTRNAVLNTIRNRVDANGVSEPVILPKGDNQFIVELPAVRNESQILEQLQNTAQLQFYYSPDWVTNKNRLGRYQFESVGGENGKREQFLINDRQTNKSYRDLFHINQELSELIENSAKTPDKAVETPLPEPLPDLNVAAGGKTVRLTPEDAKKLDALAEEMKGFNTFLSSARLEMTGSDLLPTARAGFNPSGGTEALVDLEFNREGRTKFGNFTRDHSDEILMIYLDGRILMAPNINEPILNGRAQISPFSTVQEAKQLADYLNGGALPVPLKIVQQQSVEATLGREAVQSSLTAGLVGVGAVVVFMVATYLLPGAVACLALLLYTLFTYAIFLLIPVTFTLPGIAGFILSIGMAIDANVLIFERTKEELREGKPLVRAIETGFSRAFSAIFDSNVCTAVTSLLLYNFGTGPVRGFALTLLIGVAISMFTAITVTRTLLLLVVNTPAGRNHKMWGVDRVWHPRFNTVKHRVAFYLLSLLIIVPGLVAVGMGGFKRGIEFTGGSEVTVKFSQDTPSREEIEKAVTAQGFEDAAAQIAGDNTVIIRFPRKADNVEMSAQDADKVVAGLSQSFAGQQVTRQEFGFIGSAISSELTQNALTSILFSSIFIVVYLAFRFAMGGLANGLKFGVAAIIAMLHDVLLLVGLFAILGLTLNWKVDSLFVTAALTDIGFSVHDTIVIFDRIRENLKLKGGRMSFPDLVNDSINETFTRSIYTGVTVILVLLSLLIFGGPTIRPLNAALLIGIISGTYSSIFNAAQIVVDWERLFGGKGSSVAIAGGGGSTPPRSSGGGGGAERRPTTPSAPRPTAARTPRSGTPTPGGASAADRPASDGTAAPTTGLPSTPARRKRRM
ncbi:MAG TPA: protein translocase subunit SecD [Armatimonadaceae bacterium]|nr:protein translocase subunit SecD [Armatimonadaceae bacterium]